MEPIAVDVRTAAKMLSLALPTLYQMIGAGKFPARKAGRRTLILVEDLRNYANNLPWREVA